MSDIPEFFNKIVTLDLNQRGIEMTPEQVADLRDSAYEKIRKEMRNRGYEMPDSDMEMIAVIAEVLKGADHDHE